MNGKKSSRISVIERYWTLSLSVIIAIFGICYIIAAAHLFFTGGDQPYSRERVGQYLVKLIIPSVLAIVGITGGAVIALIADKTASNRGKLDEQRLLKIASRRFNINEAQEQLRCAVIKERKTRFITTLIAALASVSAVAIAVTLAITVPVHTVEGQNAAVIKSMIFILPAAFITTGALLVADRLNLASAKRELAIISGEPKSAREQGATFSKKRAYILLAVRCSVFALAVLFIVLGIFNGGMDDVWSKAAAICTECIGLG